MAYIGSKPADKALTGADIEDGTVQIADLAATGTKDATTFLRGDGTFAEAGGGKLLQVVQTLKTDAFATSGTNSFEDVTGMSVNITPTSASSKIFIIVYLGIVSTDGSNMAHFRILRDATTVGVGNSAGSRISSNAGSITETNDAQTVGFNLLDSPSTTSEITYKIQIYPNNTSYINRLYIDADNDQYGRSSSTITVMEIGA